MSKKDNQVSRDGNGEGNIVKMHPYERIGCLIFKNTEEKMVPGVAVFTNEADDLNSAPKRSVHFSYEGEYLVVEEFGVDYRCRVNRAKEFIQLFEPDAHTLRTTGKVKVPRGHYNIVRHEKVHQ